MLLNWSIFTENALIYIYTYVAKVTTLLLFTDKTHRRRSTDWIMIEFWVLLTTLLQLYFCEALSL